MCSCLRKNNHLHIWHAMSHAQSLMFICMTFSAHSTRTPNPTSLLFPSHGDDHCDDPRHEATFGQLAQSNLTTVYEPNDLTGMNNTPIFFHRPSVTSTYDSAESIATPHPGSDLDDEANAEHAGFTTLLTGEREASADRPRRENSVSSSSRFRASAGMPEAVFSQERKSRTRMSLRQRRYSLGTSSRFPHFHFPKIAPHCHWDTRQ